MNSHLIVQVHAKYAGKYVNNNVCVYAYALVFLNWSQEQTEVVGLPKVGAGSSLV